MCAICTENYEVGEQVLDLPCDHFYHTPCIKPWLMKKSICPYCNHPIRESLKSIEEN